MWEPNNLLASLLIVAVVIKSSTPVRNSGVDVAVGGVSCPERHDGNIPSVTCMCFKLRHVFILLSTTKGGQSELLVLPA